MALRGAWGPAFYSGGDWMEAGSLKANMPGESCRHHIAAKLRNVRKILRLKSRLLQGAIALLPCDAPARSQQHCSTP